MAKKIETVKWLSDDGNYYDSETDALCADSIHYKNSYEDNKRLNIEMSYLIAFLKQFIYVNKHNVGFFRIPGVDGCFQIEQSIWKPFHARFSHVPWNRMPNEK